MFTKHAAIEIIKKFVRDCNKANIQFDKVILFGSVVGESTNDDSDIDVALVSREFTHDRFENAIKLAPISLKYNDIDAQTFPSDYFEQGDPFIEEILRSGIEIEIN